MKEQKKLRTVLYGGKFYQENDKDLPKEAREKLGIKAPKAAKKEEKKEEGK